MRLALVKIQLSNAEHPASEGHFRPTLGVFRFAVAGLERTLSLGV